MATGAVKVPAHQTWDRVATQRTEITESCYPPPRRWSDLSAEEPGSPGENRNLTDLSCGRWSHRFNSCCWRPCQSQRDGGRGSPPASPCLWPSPVPVTELCGSQTVEKPQSASFLVSHWGEGNVIGSEEKRASGKPLSFLKFFP